MRKWTDIETALQESIPHAEIQPKDPGKGIFGDFIKWSTAAAIANGIFGVDGWEIVGSTPPVMVQTGEDMIFHATVHCRFWGLDEQGNKHSKDITDTGVGLAQAQKDGKAPKPQGLDTAIKACASDGVKRCLKTLGKRMGLELYNPDLDAIAERTGTYFLQMAQAQQDEKSDPHEVFALAGEYIVAKRKLIDLWTTDTNKQLVRNLASKNDEKGIACARFVKAADAIDEMAKFGVGETRDEKEPPASKDFGKDVLAPMTPAVEKPVVSEPVPAVVTPEPVKSEPVAAQPEMVQIYDRQYKASDKIGDKVAWAWLYNHLTEFFEHQTEQLNSMRKHLSTPFTDTTWGKVAEYIAYKTQQKAEETAKSAPPAQSEPVKAPSAPASDVKWWSAQTPDSALSHWIGLYSGTTVKLQQLLMEAGMIKPENWTSKTHEQLDRMLTKLQAGELKIDSGMSGPAWMVVVTSIKQTKKA